MLNTIKYKQYKRYCINLNNYHTIFKEILKLKLSTKAGTLG